MERLFLNAVFSGSGVWGPSRVHRGSSLSYALHVPIHPLKTTLVVVFLERSTPTTMVRVSG